MDIDHPPSRGPDEFGGELPSQLEEVMRNLLSVPCPEHLAALQDMLKKQYRDTLPPLPTALWA